MTAGPRETLHAFVTMDAAVHEPASSTHRPRARPTLLHPGRRAVDTSSIRRRKRNALVRCGTGYRTRVPRFGQPGATG
jgi:hypothetical protein